MNKLLGRAVPAIALAASIAVAGGAAASAAPASELPFLGPDGYKSLKLNMTEDQAVATGLLTDRQQSGSCATYKFKASEGTGSEYGDVVVGLNGKVHSIGATSRTLTREGAWLGMRLNDVKAIYPQLVQDPEQSYLYRTATPGNAAASYVFVVNNESTTELSLQANWDANCGA